MFLVAWAHLAVLWTMAIAQPLLDVLDDSPDFFVARGNTRADILILALGLVLVPPTAMAAVVAAIPAGPIRRIVHLALVAGLVAAFVLQVLKDTGLSSAVLIPLAVALGAALGYAYTRVGGIRTGLTFLSPLPLVVLVLFLLVSPVSKLILEQGGDAAASTSPKRSLPIVVVVLDEMASSSLLDRDGSIDATRYPNFAKLARAATWYPNATTVADVTTAAVPAILSGRRPGRDDLPIRSDFPRNLFTMLGSDYRFEVEEPITDLCPERLCGEEKRPPLATRLEDLADDLSVVALHLLAPDDLEDGLPAVDRGFAGFRGGDRNRPASKAAASTETFENRTGETARFLEGIQSDDPDGSLYFLHVGLPHIPWQYLPSGRQYTINGPDLPSLAEERWEGDEWLVEQAYQRFLLQVGYTDRLIGTVDGSPAGGGAVGRRRPRGHGRPRRVVSHQSRPPERLALDRGRHRGRAAVRQVPPPAPRQGGRLRGAVDRHPADDREAGRSRAAARRRGTAARPPARDRADRRLPAGRRRRDGAVLDLPSPPSGGGQAQDGALRRGRRRAADCST